MCKKRDSVKELVFVLIVLFLLICIFQGSCLFGSDYVVKVVNDSNRYCTGIKIGKNKVLTVTHIKNGNLFINSKPVTIIKFDIENDMMILKGDFKFKKYLTKEMWCKRFKIGEELKITGFPFSKLFYDWAKISRIDKNRIYLNKNLPGGTSGGMVLKKGKFVGMIIQKLLDHHKSGHTILVHQSIIWNFLYK